MNDEIKEILDKLQKVANRETASRNALMEMKDKDYQLLLDYITKLQKENERLKAQNTRYEIKMNSLIQENNVLKENAELNDKVVDKAKWNEMIYKSRCEKAIEYIKEWQSFPHTNGSTHNELRNLLNILNGDDEE